MTNQVYVGFEWLAVVEDVYVWVSVCRQCVSALPADNGSVVGRVYRAVYSTDYLMSSLGGAELLLECIDHLD